MLIEELRAFLQITLRRFVADKLDFFPFIWLCKLRRDTLGVESDGAKAVKARKFHAICQVVSSALAAHRRHTHVTSRCLRFHPGLRELYREPSPPGEVVSGLGLSKVDFIFGNS